LRLEPFKVAVAEQVLSDLKTRIRNTRWPDTAPGTPWSQGTDLEWLRNLMDYWAEEFDWCAQEQRLGEFAQFRIEIDGVRIHFVHARARGGRGIPLILTHGWPSTFLEYLPLASLLTDPVRHDIDGPAFDLVIPSLPGYGFSERPKRTGVNYRYVSALWHQLMNELGYKRYGSGGGDFGSGAADIDDMAYDSTRKRIYVPSGEGFIFVYQQIDPDRYERIVKIPSAIGARTSAYFGQVGKHNSLYLAVPARANRGAELWIYETRD